MKELFAVLLMYWQSVLIVLVVLIVLILLWKKGKREQVKRAILWLVAEAETKLGDGSGKYKYGYVIEKFYNRLPFLIRMLFTRKEIDEFIELAVKEVKEYLESGKDLEPNIKIYEID